MKKDKVSSQPTRRVGKKTTLFFPVEVGIAHIVRSLAIAEELHKMGHRVIFALPKRKHELVRNTPVQLVDIAGYAEKDTIDFISNFKNPAYLLPHIKEELRVIKKYEPDCLVIDFRPTAMVSGALANIPTFFITGGGGLPGGCYIPNFGLPKWLHQLVSPLIQKAIMQGKGKYVESIVSSASHFNKSFSVAQVISRMHYLVPEFPGYLPALDTSLKIDYVRPIAWEGLATKTPDWLRKIKRDAKTIYLTFGGTGFDREKFAGIAITLVEKGYRVIVSSSTIAPVDDFPKHPRLFVEKFLPAQEVCKHVDLMICHGGYGTMIDAVQSGIPIIALPFNPDQLLHSLRFAEYGVARIVLGSVRDVVFGVLNFDWKKLQNLGREMSVDRVVFEAQKILNNPVKYQKALVNFQKLMPPENGAHQAARVISSMIQVFLL